MLDCLSNISNKHVCNNWIIGKNPVSLDNPIIVNREWLSLFCMTFEQGGR